MDDSTLNVGFIKTRYIFIIMLVGLILFFFSSLFLVDNKLVNNIKSLDGIFRILIPIVGILSMILANIIYNKKINRVFVNEGIEDKVNIYRSIKIIQWAIIEGAGFLSLIGFIITQNYLYSIIFLFLIGYFYLLKPTKAQLKSDMKI